MADARQAMPEVDTSVPQTARTEPGAADAPEIDQYCAVGRKP
ncbi:hypothetical protein [Actinoplanes nipponensis]|nr:hypothetical protein [Actinoplanes nipponensis]